MRVLPQPAGRLAVATQAAWEAVRAHTCLVGPRLPACLPASSMMQASTYRCAFWTLQKPGADAGPATAAGGQQESAPPL